ncbi:MAG: DUF4860 domain-containing protein [Oscillospiraceae bacterium]|nr:DUF4860 domain-containing protein [Oscillospiraceae bacterium]
MKRQAIKHHMNGLAALLLFGVFAVCVLAVLVTGAQAYRRLTKRDMAAYDRRTCIQYITTHFHQADVLDAVTVERVDGTDCLTFAEDIGGERYTTRIYCYDGYLCELFSADADGVGLEAGERVMEADALSASMADSLLTVTVTVDGEESTFCLSQRSGEGGAA